MGKSVKTFSTCTLRAKKEKAVYSFILSNLEWWCCHLVVSNRNTLELTMNSFKRYFNLHGAQLEARSFSELLATLSSPLNFSHGYMDLQGFMQNNKRYLRTLSHQSRCWTPTPSPAGWRWGIPPQRKLFPPSVWSTAPSWERFSQKCCWIMGERGLHSHERPAWPWSMN